jgi:hypothetical protein
MSTEAVVVERALTPEEIVQIRAATKKVKDAAIAAERAAIVRAIRAEAEDYYAKARDIWMRDPQPSLEDMRHAVELRAKCGALQRMAVIISQRETEGDRS